MGNYVMLKPPVVGKNVSAHTCRDKCHLRLSGTA